MFNNYNNYNNYSNYNLLNTLKTNPIYGQSTDLFRNSGLTSSQSLYGSNNLFSSCPTCSGGSSYSQTLYSNSYKIY